MTYSIQFRKKVLKLQATGESFIKLSERFKISPTTISRWKKQLAPLKHRNKKPVKIDYEALKKDIQEHPDSYSYERALRLGVSTSGIRYAKKRLGISYKKNTKPSQSRSRKKIYILPKNKAITK
jgi:transposase